MKIQKKVITKIIEQAKAELPAEACGYLLGKDGVITFNYTMTNIDHSPEHFSFDPAEQFATIRYARQEGLDIMGNWHSHPASPSRPSQEDIRLAYGPADTLFYPLSTGRRTRFECL
ncbi:MAG: M67 family metallopeptidase [Tannerellaceae bacterium]|nr:M67 family metallopeptidase [Tannerellaceae bacterium]